MEGNLLEEPAFLFKTLSLQLEEISLPEFKEPKKRSPQKKASASLKATKAYKNYRRKNTLKAREIRYRKKEEKKAKKHRLDEALKKNNILKLMEQYLGEELLNIKYLQN